jgi:hypothetical protein
MARRSWQEWLQRLVVRSWFIVVWDILFIGWGVYWLFDNLRRHEYLWAIFYFAFVCMMAWFANSSFRLRWELRALDKEARQYLIATVYVLLHVALVDKAMEHDGREEAPEETREGGSGVPQ